MTDTADDKRIFLAPGELRTDVLELFADTPAGLDLLLAAPFDLIDSTPLVAFCFEV